MKAEMNQKSSRKNICRKKWEMPKPNKIILFGISLIILVSVGIITAEDFGCEYHFDISKNFETFLHHTDTCIYGAYERGMT